MKKLSPRTQQIYRSAQKHFKAWCDQRTLGFPPPPAEVAKYLRACARKRGASVVPVQLSAITRLHLETGKPFDSKYGAIQKIIAAARADMREGV